VNFYKQKTTAAGMAQTMSAEMGETTTYVAANDKTKQTVSVSATKGGDGTTVQLTWGEK
jgi:dihydroxyacetone kinase